MVSFDDNMTSSPDFDVATYTFKKIGGHEILTDVLVPKQIPAGTHPVWIRIHGGYLVGHIVLLPCTLELSIHNSPLDRGQ